MSKAITGAALLAGAVAVGGLEFLAASTGVGVGAMPFLIDLQEALVVGGIGMEAGAIASALTSNRGMNITTRQPASPRQIIYGMQRVGGVELYSSTTGSKHDQYNFCIVLATHVVNSIDALYLDGRRVYFEPSDGQRTSPGGVLFGGQASGLSYTGPDGQQYSFSTLVYAEMRCGEQADGDYITGFTANDPTWGPSSAGTPYVGGCTYIYLKVEYDTSTFPQKPEVRLTLRGKQVYDPRTGTTAYSANSALVAADWCQDPVYGLGIPVNQAQLIAAANVCDEQVTLAAGGSEARYTCHYHFDTSTPPSDAFAAMLKSMGGRATMIGGEMYIVPAYWQGPSASFDESSLTAPVSWDATLSYKDLCNRVTGTYTAPNYPYNVSGNAYDANGFDSDGNAQNNFSFGFQTSSFPQYAADQSHGYPVDEYLNEDSGVTAPWTSGATFNVGDVVSYSTVIAGVPFASVWRSLIAVNIGNAPSPTSTAWVNAAQALGREISLPMVLSIAQAQRLAKIEMMRSRFPGGGSLEMTLAALTMQNFDVMNFTFPQEGWTDKPLEIAGMTHKVITQDPEEGQPPAPPEYRLLVDVHETDASIYEWSVYEEQTIYGLPGTAAGKPIQPLPPTDMELISSASTALVAPDGTVTPRIEVTWDTPLDGYVKQIQVQYQKTGDTAWISAGMADVSLNSFFIAPVISGQMYDVRIRSLRSNGAASPWVEIDGFTAGLVLNVQTQDGVGIGSLVSAAYSDGTAAITCNPFTAYIGSVSLPIFPAGAVTLSGLAQQTLYYVYYVDPTFAGGNVTPIATTNPADFRGKIGYFLIDSIVTGYCSSSGTASRFYPSTFSDTGTQSTSSPTQAYDNNLATYATVSGVADSIYVPPPGSRKATFAYGDCTWFGFPATVTTSALNLYIVATGTTEVDGGAVEITVNVTIAGTAAGVSFPINSGQQTATVAIPIGTNLSSVLTEIKVHAAAAGSGTDDASASGSMQVAEIYIDV